jgi:hypothetical protein
MQPIDTKDTVYAGYRYFLLAIDKFCAGRWWRERIWLLCLLLVFWHISPFFNFHYFDSPNWDAMEAQSRSLLTPIPANGDTHVEKMAFRLFIPAVAGFFGLDREGIFLGQILAGIVFLRLLIGLVFRLLDDRTATFFFAVGVTACYVCFSAFYDVFGRPDIYPYLFLLLALSWRNPVGIWLLCAAAEWSDERGLIHSTLVYLFWVLKEEPRPGFRQLIFPNKYAAAVALSWVSYLLIRFWLSRHAGFETGYSDVGHHVIFGNSRFYALATFSTFGANWLLIGLAVLLCFARMPVFGLALIVALGLNWLTSVLVFDINRSLSYSFTALPLALLVLSRHSGKSTIRVVCLFVAAFSLLQPQVVWDGHYHYLPPLPVRLVEVFLRP